MFRLCVSMLDVDFNLGDKFSETPFQISGFPCNLTRIDRIILRFLNQNRIIYLFSLLTKDKSRNGILDPLGLMFYHQKPGNQLNKFAKETQILR